VSTPLPPPSPQSETAGAFEAAARQHRTGFLSELWHFLKTNKKWWLAPLLVFFVLLGLLMFLAGTPAGPFLYTLF
jgi:hypothetical protein